jgi:hypothetical protein
MCQKGAGSLGKIENNLPGVLSRALGDEQLLFPLSVRFWHPDVGSPPVNTKSKFTNLRFSRFTSFLLKFQHGSRFQKMASCSVISPQFKGARTFSKNIAGVRVETIFFQLNGQKSFYAFDMRLIICFYKISQNFHHM